MMRTLLTVVAWGLILASPAAAQICEVAARLEPQLSVGAEQGIHFEVRDVEVDPQGRVFVTQISTPHVTVLNRTGAQEGTIGRAGDGPGEFPGHVPWTLGWIGDTLWVAEHPARGGVHFFLPDGGFVRRVGVRELIPTGDGVLRVTMAEPFADGSFLGGMRWPYNHMQPENAVHPIIVLDAAGSIRDTLALYPFPESPVVMERAWGPHPLHRHLTPRLTEDGSGVLWIEDRPEVGRFSVVKGTPMGHVSELFSIPYRPRPIERAQRQRILDTYLAAEERSVGPVGRARKDGIIAALARVLPTSFPPVRVLLPGHDGDIWLLREPREDGIDRWEVYTPAGSLSMAVHVDFGAYYSAFPSPRIDIHHVHGDEVWASTRGEFDEVTLHRFRVVQSC